MASENTENKQLIDNQIQTAIASSNIPKIYANGFICAQTTSDVFVVLQANGQTNAILNLSYTAAKSLANDLKQMIVALEKQTGHQIMTVNEINAKTKDK